MLAGTRGDGSREVRVLSLRTESGNRCVRDEGRSADGERGSASQLTVSELAGSVRVEGGDGQGRAVGDLWLRARRRSH